jgi:hypothetical protein
VPEFENHFEASPGPRAGGDRESLASGAAATRTLDARAEVRLGGAVRDLTARMAPTPATARSHDAPERMALPVAEIEPTITATLTDGPLEGSSIQVAVVEGRPPKTIDVPADDGSTCRYCLAGWVQSGRSAAYTFLYRV